MYYIYSEKEPEMEPILTYIKKSGGFARMKDLKKQSFHPREIARLVQIGELEKVKPGLYRLASLQPERNVNLSFVEICRAAPRGIICLASALAHHELVSFVPSEIQVALPLSAKPPRITYPPTHFFFFPERFYTPGTEQIETKAGVVRIYNAEKSICDLFRYRKRLGEDLALEALKTYLRRKDSDLNALVEYARICQVKSIMLPYLKALAG
jgi:predicted transcriptional regulator of viral defense system